MTNRKRSLPCLGLRGVDDCFATRDLKETKALPEELNHELSLRPGRVPMIKSHLSRPRDWGGLHRVCDAVGFFVSVPEAS